MYGLAGNMFRGITAEIDLNTGGTNSGTFSAFEGVTWTGGTGQLLAIDNTTASSATKMWIQILTGTAPGNAVLITGVSTATATTASSNALTDREATLTFPFIGASTGSAIIGGYGINVDKDDLTASDTLFDLTNTAVYPPNNVQVEIGGLESGEDYVTVTQRGYRFAYDGEADGPFVVGETLTFASAGTAILAELVDQGTEGYMIISEPSIQAPVDDETFSGGTSSADGVVNGTPSSDINKRQLTLDTALTIDNVSAVVVNETIPSDTPSANVIIRVQDNDGYYRKLNALSWTGSTFTVNTTNGEEDFNSVNADSGNNVYIGYIDKEAASGTESFTAVYSADRNLFVRVRDGGTAGDNEGIKTFETTVTMGSSGGSATAIRTSDE
jgi:hypothetical protein